MTVNTRPTYGFWSTRLRRLAINRVLSFFEGAAGLLTANMPTRFLLPCVSHLSLSLHCGLLSLLGSKLRPKKRGNGSDRSGTRKDTKMKEEVGRNTKQPVKYFIWKSGLHRRRVWRSLVSLIPVLSSERAGDSLQHTF